MRRVVADSFTPDEIDRRIIVELQQDGRRAYGRVAKAVGLSEAATRMRTQRMIEEEVIRIVAVPDPARLGMFVAATLAIRCTGDLTPVLKALDDVPEIDFVVATSGGYDLLAEVLVEDHEHLYRIINDEVRVLPGVRSVESLIYLKYQKLTFSWPPGTRALAAARDRDVKA